MERKRKQGSTSQTERRLFLNPERPPSTVNQPWIPGEIELVSDSGPTVIEAMQRSLIHELGHHIQWAHWQMLEPLALAAWKQGNPISPRAKADWKEYFAEALAAYTFYRRDLQEHDLVGYNFIVQVLGLIGARQ